jgi:peptidoglycan hydrolase CwlO-like protein
LFTLPVNVKKLISQCVPLLNPSDPSSAMHVMAVDAISDLLLLLEKSLQIVAYLLQTKELSLKTLLRAEGVKAFDQVIHVSSVQVSTLYQELKDFQDHNKGTLHDMESLKEVIKDTMKRIQSFTALELSLSSLE